MTPNRIQLKRTKGWRKPDGAIVVARPGPWGNLFRVGVHGDAVICVLKYRNLVNGLISLTQPCPDYGAQVAVQTHVREQIGTLRGHDLACWCPPGAPCHADVLLELANAECEVPS